MKTFITCAFLSVILTTATASQSASNDSVDFLPAPRLTARPASGVISLNGEWSFCTNGLSGPDWKPINVPGEWMMQGFTVKPETAAGYRREFKIPSCWRGQRIKLRFDAVHSLCHVYVNSKEIGGHEGGMVPFEFDITDLVKSGKNTLELTVQSESLADKLSCISQYAEHQVGGILRKVQLFAVPAVNIADLKVETTFDKDYKDAILKVKLQIANEGTTEATGVTCRLMDRTEKIPAIPAGQTVTHVIEIPVPNAPKWDNEHPRLQTLKVKLSSGHAVETKFGYRQVEVRGPQVFVNGQPIKLRGVCRHEVHPLLGRALTEPWWRKDAELYREMNCNFIRTSHYPPAEEFLDACDELGLFVELEAPLCWVWHKANKMLKGNEPKGRLLYLANVETVQSSYNHPSVIMRSLANESGWQPDFETAGKAVSELDPTRPMTFHNQGGFDANPPEKTAIGNFHYPGFKGPEDALKLHRPITFGEYCHLNAYNRFELSADPGIRDAWGRGFGSMWDLMFASQPVLGGSIWAAMDDTFHLPDGRSVGYGTWGPLDGWRRAKPEAWHVFKAYSPMRIDETQHSLPAGGKKVEFPVLNQANFLNLREFDIRWSIGKDRGKIDADVQPHAKGTLQIVPKHTPQTGDTLKIEVRDPRGFVADKYAFVFGEPTLGPSREGNKNFDLTAVSHTTGFLTGDVSGPTLMVLPLNGKGGKQMGGKYFYPPDNRTATNWILKSVEAKPDSVTVTGEYDEAAGQYTYTVASNGELNVAYRFTMKRDVNPRQVGLVFDLPRAWDTIAWERNAPYTVYPADHIGRPAGAARAFGKKDHHEPVNLREHPKWPWSEDTTEGGSQDFRSTKEHITWYQVADRAGRGVRVLSNGRQHARVWVDGDKVRLLVADYSNAGAEGFFRNQASREDRPLKKGSEIFGVVRLQINSSK